MSIDQILLAVCGGLTVVAGGLVLLAPLAAFRRLSEPWTTPPVVRHRQTWTAELLETIKSVIARKPRNA